MLHHVAVVRTDVSERNLVFLHSVRRLLVTATFLVHRFLSPWWWRRWVPPKRRFLQGPHGVTFQKTPFLVHFSSYLEFWRMGKVHKPSHCSVAVLCRSTVALKMPTVFTNWEYMRMHCIFCFCSGNGKATVMSYWQQYPHLGIPHHKTFLTVHRTLKETSSWRMPSCGLLTPCGSCKNRRFGGT
jgi:hypothetical protein